MTSNVSLNENEFFELLVFGYGRYVSSQASDALFVPEVILDMILLYVPKSYWLTAGKQIRINDVRDTVTAHP